jgi:hypothetical protein
MIKPSFVASLVAGIAAAPCVQSALAAARVVAIDLSSIVPTTNEKHRLARGTNQLKYGIFFVHPWRMNENSTNEP